MRKEIVSTALLYKFLTAWTRIYLGILIIVLDLDLHKLTKFLLENKIIRNSQEHLMNYFLVHLRDTSRILTLSLALMLLVFSLLELIFIFALA